MTPAPDRSDADLVAAVLAGDAAAFRGLLARHRDAVYRLVRARVGAADEAEDLVQEVFASAHRALRRYDPGRPLRTWLLGIAINRCRDWGRRRAVRAVFANALSLGGEALEVAADQPGADRIADDRAALARTWRAIAALPAHLAEPLLLTAVEGLPQAEAARLLGISAKAVETRVARARARLRTLLPDEG